MNDAAEYYKNFYEKITNSGAVGVVAKVGHLTLERWPFVKPRFSKNSDLLEVLEVGAGHGQHQMYVNHNFKNYTMTDMRPNLLLGKPLQDPRIAVELDSVNAENLPYDDNSFDRLIATCLLIHLDNPEKALQEWKRVVRPGGVISIYVPCEPGLLLRILQSVTTRRKQKKAGLDAKYLHYGEHSYSYPFILTIIKKTFNKNYSLRSFPFFFGSFDINLWSIVTVVNKK